MNPLRSFLILAFLAGSALAQPLIRIAAVDRIAREIPFGLPGLDTAAFEISRAGDLSREVRVWYSIHGAASNGADYEELATSVVIPTAHASVTVKIVPKPDLLTYVEPMETVGLRLEDSLLMGMAPSYVLDQERREAGIVIYENMAPPSGAVELAIPRKEFAYANADEVRPMAAVYTTNRITGVEFYDRDLRVATVPLPNATNGLFFASFHWTNAMRGAHVLTARVIGADGTQATSSPIPFSVGESIPGLPVVGISALWAHTSEPGNEIIAPGLFRVTRTGPTTNALTVYLNYSGLATRNVDYKELARNVTLPVGASEVDIRVEPIDDSIAEEVETVVAAFEVTSAPYLINDTFSRATVFIHDNKPGATITITAPENSEFFNAGTTIRIDAIAVDPAGYMATLEFFANETRIGASHIDFLVAPAPGTPIHHFIQWTNVPTGLYLLTARGQTTHSKLTVSNPVRIQIDGGEPRPLVSITREPEEISEPTPTSRVTPGRFIVRRAGSMENPLAVFLRYEGTATQGFDYEPLPEKIVIPAGTNHLEFQWFAKMDSLAEPTESVTAHITAPMLSTDPDPANRPYQINSEARAATILIRDGVYEPLDAIVRITAVDPSATEFPPFADGFDPARFQITRVGDLSRSLLVFFTVHGTATGGLDYPALSNTVTIPAGSNSVDIMIVPKSDVPTDLHHYEIVRSEGISWLDARTRAPEETYRGVKGHLATIGSREEDEHIETLRVAAGGGTFWVGGYQEATELSITGGWKWVNNEGTIPGSNDERSYGNWLAGEPNDYWGPGSENYLAVGWLNTFGWNDQDGRVPAQGYVVEFDTYSLGPTEKMETVGLRLEESALAGPLPTYLVDPTNRMAGIVIFEQNVPVDGVVEIAVPGAGEIYYGQVEFLANAFDGITDVNAVHFYVDGNDVGASVLPQDSTWVGGVKQHLFKWRAATAGNHVVQAKVIRADGTAAVSSEIPFVVLGGNASPVATVTKPGDGASFAEGETVVINATGFDSDGIITRLELLVDGHVVNFSTNSSVVFALSGGNVGEHILTAQATDHLGAVGTSAPVRILIRRVEPASFVTRELPASYVPGAAFVVELHATPPANSNAYAVEDRPPTGWAVSEISPDGFFDGSSGKVKFGPFTDAAARSLTYRVTPPVTATGTKEFSGAGSVNGTSYPIAGDHAVEQIDPFHPADGDANQAIVLNELTAYASAWKAGESWPIGPVPIPLSYVTRAGFIWKRGEAYRFDPTAGPAPACWVPINAGGPRLQDFTTNFAARVFSGSFRAGVASEVQVRVRPKSGASSYALEEKPPAGWAVSNISSGGRYDARAHAIRWGIYTDETERTFSYTLTPRAAVASSGNFSGEAAVDGERVRIASSALFAAPATPIAVSQFERAADGAVRFQVTGPRGQSGFVESSADLQTWQRGPAVYLPDGAIEISATTTGSGPVFYRFRAE